MMKRVISIITCAALCLSVLFCAALVANADRTVYLTPSGRQYGDVNSDDKINLFDLVLMRKYLAKWSVTVDTEATDVTADGKINLLDLILMRKYLAKWNVSLGKPHETTGETTTVIPLPTETEVPPTTEPNTTVMEPTTPAPTTPAPTTPAPTTPAPTTPAPTTPAPTTPAVTTPAPTTPAPTTPAPTTKPSVPTTTDDLWSDLY